MLPPYYALLLPTLLCMHLLIPLISTTYPIVHRAEHRNRTIWLYGCISMGAITVLYVINFNFKTAVPVWAVYRTQPYNLWVKTAVNGHTIT
jgi:hypothetical protein